MEDLGLLQKEIHTRLKLIESPEEMLSQSKQHLACDWTDEAINEASNCLSCVFQIALAHQMAVVVQVSSIWTESARLQFANQEVMNLI
jgi:hypothetical protein